MKFTIDVRHYNPAVIEQALAIIRKMPDEIVGCKVSYAEAWARKSVAYDPLLVDTVEESAVACNYTHMRIHSGPGHDAQFAADILPTAMIFVPSVEGHSHCELEYTPVEACAKGVNVLIQTLLALDAKLS